MIKQAIIQLDAELTTWLLLPQQKPGLPGVNQSSAPLDYLLQEFTRYGFEEILLLVDSALADSLPPPSKCRGATVRFIPTLPDTDVGAALLCTRINLHPSFVLISPLSRISFNLLDMEATSPKDSWLGKAALVFDAPDSPPLDAEAGAPSSMPTEGRVPRDSGVYILKRSILEPLKEDGAVSLKRDLFPQLRASGLLKEYTYSLPPTPRSAPETTPPMAPGLLAGRRRPAVFLDRDGVLNRDSGYVHTPGNFQWIPGAKDTVKRLNDQGYYVIVITNQSGVARGYYPEEAVESLHHWMNDELRTSGAHIDAYYYCPHHNDGIVEELRLDCECRKPKPGLIQRALKAWPIITEDSFLIGDKPRDLEAARRAGIPGHLFKGDNLHTFLKEKLLTAGA